MTFQKNILVVDNFDSFTYNLVEMIREISCSIDIYNPNQIYFSFDKLNKYDYVIISPGPGLPLETQYLLNVIERLVYLQIPILGICLGHQAIAMHFGAKLFRREYPLHGQLINIQVIEPSSKLFQNMPEIFQVGLYHSWAVLPSSLPNFLRITAISSEGIVMAFEHIIRPIYGVQFHPESYMTTLGVNIIYNFLQTK